MCSNIFPEMDFSLLSATMDQIVQDQNKPDVNPNAIGKPQINLQLDTDKELKEIQQKKKENELSHKQKAKKNKKIERSQGYIDRITQSEKQKMKGNNKKKNNKNRKCNK